MSATGKRSDAGFTLIEMLVVLAIAALVAGIGFPRMQGQIAAQEWRTAVASVTAQLRTARARAVLSGRPVTVAAAGSGMRIDAGVPTPLPASVTLAAPLPVIFFGDGSASGGEIGVRSGARRRVIAVSPATGLLLTRTP